MKILNVHNSWSFYKVIWVNIFTLLGNDIFFSLDNKNIKEIKK